MAGDYCGILAQLVSQMRLSDCDDDLARVYVRTGWIRWRREEANVENRERVSWRRCGRRISPFYTQTGFFPSPGINYSRPLVGSKFKFGEEQRDRNSEPLSTEHWKEMSSDAEQALIIQMAVSCTCK